MKKLGNRGIVMVMGFLLACILGVSSVKAQGSVSMQVFYDELQPYGTWIHHNQHGYVWMPRVDRGFVPYATGGYWISTEYGNTWVSDYSWGWAPFHYGRWFYDDFYGWMWVPDTVWGPAWVAWRSGGGYYGWAPLMPGLGFSVSFSYYNRIPHHYWSFVPYRYITYRSVYRHCVPRPHVVNIINHTTIVTNNYTDNRTRHTYITGPSRREIERTTQERVRTYAVSDLNRPGRTAVERDRASFYKPEVDDSKASRLNAMPSRYMRDNGSGRLEQVEARREGTSGSYRERSLQNDLQKRQDQRGVEPNSSRMERSRNLDQMESLQQRDMQRENDAFERFKRERENPSRDIETNRAEEMRRLEQQNNARRDEQLRSNNSELRRQQLERQNEALREQRNLQQRENNLREEQFRSNGNDVRRQQFEKQNEMMQEQRNLQRQRDNAVMEQQRNNENVRRQQFERQNSQREFSRPNEMRRTQPQSLQRIERPTQERFNRSNSNFERQRSSPQQEIRRTPSDRSGGSPSRNPGGNSSRRYN
ncbi:MAG TPA: DUF6600 domain-containing protein [Chryseolinea sp.]